MLLCYEVQNHERKLSKLKENDVKYAPPLFLKGCTTRQLILESTFTRLPDVAAEAGFWGSLAAAVTTLEFDSLSKIKHVDAPILMLHGSADKTVPVQLGRRLRDAAPARSRWVEVKGGSHSRLFSDAPELYQETMRTLIQTLSARSDRSPLPP